MARTSARTLGSTTLFLVGMSGQTPPLRRPIASSMSTTFRSEHSRRWRATVVLPAHAIPITNSLTSRPYSAHHAQRPRLLVLERVGRSDRLVNSGGRRLGLP